MNLCLSDTVMSPVRRCKGLYNKFIFFYLLQKDKSDFEILYRSLLWTLLVYKYPQIF